MKLYLSSYRVGDHAAELVRLAGPNVKVAVIDNARDGNDYDSDKKTRNLHLELERMEKLGFRPHHLDLKTYFNKKNLADELAKFEAIWVSGGNAFILMKAMKQSGFDVVIEKLIKTNKIVYAGYSAGFCAVSPSLRGIELVDDAKATAEGYQEEIIWDGYGLVDFYPIVHYKSDHHESHLIEKVLEYVQAKGKKYKTFRDGEVYIVDD